MVVPLPRAYFDRLARLAAPATSVGVLEAAERHSERQARWHGRLIRALRPYGDRSTSVGDALRRAVAELGTEADGRGFEASAEVVVVAEARGERWASDRPQTYVLDDVGNWPTFGCVTAAV